MFLEAWVVMDKCEEKANIKGFLSSACLHPSTPDPKVTIAYEASFSVVSELLQTSPPS